MYRDVSAGVNITRTLCLRTLQKLYTMGQNLHTYAENAPDHVTIQASQTNKAFSFTLRTLKRYA